VRKIQNANMSFRVTADLKKRLTKFCEENDLHGSLVIREALAVYLKRQKEADLPRLMVEQPSLSRLR
jgi:predicted transcriptional regulator